MTITVLEIVIEDHLVPRKEPHVGLILLGDKEEN